jgi:glycerol-3-phosphate dehydrogenase (NAD(P)+)
MMGSALSVPLTDSGHDVRLVGTHLDDHITTSLSHSGFHPTLGIHLPRSIEAVAYCGWETAASDAEVIVVGVSSAGVRWAGERLAPVVRPDVPVLMITKGLGIADSAIVTLPDLLQSYFPSSVRARVQPAAIAGPCIAGELARRVPTCVVVTGRDARSCDKLKRLLETDYYRVFVSHDLVGVEVCAALKNAFAMGMAFGAGMHERAGGSPGPVALHNVESAVLAQSVVEMQHCVRALGGDPDTVVGLAGIGDLDVTCNGGRTGRFGKLLGSGVELAAALERMQGVTLECREILSVIRAALPLLEARKQLLHRAVPLLTHLASVALDGAPVAIPFERFFGP